jgi:hypothetical protein
LIVLQNQLRQLKYMDPASMPYSLHQQADQTEQELSPSQDLSPPFFLAPFKPLSPSTLPAT